MKIVLFSFLGFNIYSHGVFLTLSMIVSGWLIFRFAKREKLSTKKFLPNYLCALITGIVISRLAYYLVNIGEYRSFFELALIWQGGLISFAGFLAGAAVFLVLLKKQAENLEKWLDITGIVFPLSIAIGRIGCALNGEFGAPTDSFLSYYGVMPTPVLEIYLCLLIFALNITIYKKFSTKILPYFLIFLFVEFYLFGRIFIDSWRLEKNLIIGVNSSQLTSIIILLSLTVIYLRYILKKRNYEI